MNRLLAVDPGSATGFAIGDPTDGRLLQAGVLAPYEACEFFHHLAMKNLAELTIVCERFTITTRTIKLSRGGSYDAIEVIGALRYFSLTYCGRDLAFQGPAEVMELFPDRWLRERGWWNKSEHARDATRHLARSLARSGAIHVA